MQDKIQPIIIKKINGGHGHHGGSWKVALADFTTAMMAFFLLMWLMGSTSQEQKAAISEHFNNPSPEFGASPSPAASAIQGPGGASTSMIDMGGAMDMKRSDLADNDNEGAPAPDEMTVDQLAEQQEQKRLEQLMKELKEAIDKSQALKPFKDQLLLEITPEGLRIQIVDKENRPMFDSGSARLKPYTYDLLKELAHFINEVPNRISITGHTDASRYVSRRDYSNWELSADRANAARRALHDGGMNPAKTGRIVGLGSSVLFDKSNAYNPVNRRISIIVMTRKAADDISRDAGGTPQKAEPGTQATEPAPAVPAPVTPAPEAATPAPSRPADKEKNLWQELDQYLEPGRRN